MLRRMSSKELSEWMAYFRIEAEDREEREQRAKMEHRAAEGAARRVKHPQRRRGRSANGR